MTDTFTLDVVQAAEIKYAAIRADATNADIKALSSGDNFAKILPFLRGLADIVAKPVLKFVGTTLLPAQPRFVARDHFKVDTSESAEVKIAYLWPDFENNFLGKIEEATPEVRLAFRTLEKNLLDKEIRAEIGKEWEETTLSQFYACLKAQDHGQSGELLTNGYANIFYIRDIEGTLWVVGARWRAVSGGWDVDARSVSFPGRWVAGRQVVSRSSIK